MRTDSQPNAMPQTGHRAARLTRAVLVALAAATGLGLMTDSLVKKLGDLRRGDVSVGGLAMVANRRSGKDHASRFAADLLEAPAGADALDAGPARSRRMDRPSRAIRGDLAAAGPNRCALGLAGRTGFGGLLEPAAVRSPRDGPGGLVVRAEPESPGARTSDHDGDPDPCDDDRHEPPVLGLPAHRAIAAHSSPRRSWAGWRSRASSLRLSRLRFSDCSGTSPVGRMETVVRSGWP